MIVTKIPVHLTTPTNINCKWSMGVQTRNPFRYKSQPAGLKTKPIWTFNRVCGMEKKTSGVKHWVSARRRWLDSQFTVMRDHLFKQWATTWIMLERGLTSILRNTIRTWLFWAKQLSLSKNTQIMRLKVLNARETASRWRNSAPSSLTVVRYPFSNSQTMPRFRRYRARLTNNNLLTTNSWARMSWVRLS